MKKKTNTYPDTGCDLNKKEKPCKKACEDNNWNLIVKWDHEVAEEVHRVKAWIEAIAIVGVANLLLCLAIIISFLFRK